MKISEIYTDYIQMPDAEKSHPFDIISIHMNSMGAFVVVDVQEKNSLQQVTYFRPSIDFLNVLYRLQRNAIKEMMKVHHD